MIKPAIVAVGYNRPEAMKRLLNSIIQASYPCDNITLIVSIDESNQSNAVQKVAEEIEWKYGEKIIRRFPQRQGLRKHVLQCGDLSEKYGAIIVLEDDLVVSPSFYYYTQQAANYYEKYEKLAGISLYSHAWNGYSYYHFMPEKNEYDNYLGNYSISWGQCWIADRWKHFKEWYIAHEDRLPKQNDYLPDSILQWNDHSWGKYYASYVVENNLFYVVPYESMSTNFSEVGQHRAVTDTSHQVRLTRGVKKQFSFAPISKAIKYDMFFERIFDSNMTIAGINADEICVNLNGAKCSTLGKKYLLTLQRYPFKLIASFGLNMRPIDANIVDNVPGNDIMLYECSDDEVLVTHRFNKKRAIYECYSLSWRIDLYVGVQRVMHGILTKLKRRIKK